MKHHTKGKSFNINPGDTVKFKCFNKTYEGKVESVHNWGPFHYVNDTLIRKEDDWYLEMMIYDHPDRTMVGYGYWKQGVDGGHVISINGREVSS